MNPWKHAGGNVEAYRRALVAAYSPEYSQIEPYSITFRVSDGSVMGGLSARMHETYLRERKEMERKP